jgi:hypothetical protein
MVRITCLMNNKHESATCVCKQQLKLITDPLNSELSLHFCISFPYISECSFVAINCCQEDQIMNIPILAKKTNCLFKVIVSSSPDRVKPKNIKLVFVASPLTKQH